MKALIIGGGMAGPVTAMALHKVGIDAEVFEAYDHGADGVGAFLTLAVNGMDALRAVDLHTQVRDKGIDTPRMVLSMGSGRRLAEFDFGTPLDDGTVNQTITRADMYGVLRDAALRQGVPVNYGKRLLSAESTPDGVVARFADGSSARGDLLIGADGLRSATRQIIDPHAPSPRYMPLLNSGGYARGLELDAEPGVMHMTFARHGFFCYLVNPNGETWWFSNLPQRREISRDELVAISHEQWRAKQREMFGRDRIPAVRIIDATEELFAGWNTYDFPTVPTWHRDRMIIIGDAAHATSPAAGQGASLAIEDAVVLAQCLRDCPDIPSAFAAYESLRRHRVERVVAQGKRNGDGKALGLLGRIVLPLVFKFAPQGDQSWMYDHHVDWDARVAA